MSRWTSFASAHVAAGEHCLPVRRTGSPATHATNDSEKPLLEGKLNEKMPRWERLAWRALRAARTRLGGTGGGGGVSPAGTGLRASTRYATWVCAYECRENGLAVMLEVPSARPVEGHAGPPVIDPPPHLFFAVPGIAGGNFRFEYVSKVLVSRRLTPLTTTLSNKEGRYK